MSSPTRSWWMAVAGIIVLAWFPPHGASAQDSTWISDIRFEGITRIPAGEARRLLPPRLPAGIDADSLRKYFLPILEYYQHLGYYFARIDSIGVQGLAGSERWLGVRIHEDGRLLIDSVGFDGMRLFSYREATSLFDTKPGSVLIDKVLEIDIRRLLFSYSEHGYPFTSITIESISEDSLQISEERGLKVILRIIEGPYVTINRVEIVGNETTRPEVILREARVTPGEEYKAGEMDAIRQRLMRLGIFSSVDEPEIVMSEQGTALRIRVTETAMNTFDGIIGYLPPQGSQPGIVTGLADVLLKNLFGSGRRLAAHWQHDSPLTQELRLQYLEPWIAGLPLNVGVGFFQRQQDTTYVQRTYNLKADVIAFDRLTLSGLLLTDQVIPSATQQITPVPGSTSVSAGLEIRYDTRDDPAAPSHGYLYQNDIEVGRKKITNGSTGSGEHSSVQRYTLDFEWYLSTFLRQVLATAIHGRELRSGAITQPDLFRFGGARTLRGYRENQFLGSRLVWGTLEYRLATGRRAFTYAFTDAGYYLNPGDPDHGVQKFQASKIGYGIGFQFETGLGILRVSYALGQGDTFTTGKIHFGIVNDF